MNQAEYERVKGRLAKLMQCVFCGLTVSKDERQSVYTRKGINVLFAGYCHPECFADADEEATPGAFPAGDPT